MYHTDVVVSLLAMLVPPLTSQHQYTSPIRAQPDCSLMSDTLSYIHSFRHSYIGGIVYLLSEQGEPPQAVQELFAAALVEVQSRQGRVGLLQSEEQKGPTFLLHCDGPEVAHTEAERPLALLMAVV